MFGKEKRKLENIVATWKNSNSTSKFTWLQICKQAIPEGSERMEEILSDESDLINRRLTTAVRKLTPEDEEKLKKQNSRLVTSFQAGKLEENAKKYWDQFYNRNKTKFFKDRHWTTREFKELIGDVIDKYVTLLEIGCGVGNLIYPLIEEGTNMKIFACDFSPRAVEYVKNNQLFDSNKITAFQADVVSDDLLDKVGVLIDYVTMVFVLSAIHPDKFKTVITNVWRVLRFGGVVLFRDYGIHDMTQIRFKAGHKIDDNFYMRQDGTRSYFFSLTLLNDLFTENGFEVIDSNYIETRTVNKKEGVNVPRVFVQAKFKKIPIF